MKKYSLLLLLFPVILFGMNPFFNGLNSSVPLSTVNDSLGVYSFIQNPALLDKKNQDFAFSYNILYQDITASAMMVKLYNNQALSLASGFQYLYYGAFSDGIHSYNMSAKQFVLGGNFFLIPNFQFGLNFKYENERFLDSYNNGFSLDVGLLKSIKLNSSQIRIGLTILNPVLLSSDILISPDVQLAFGMKGKINNRSFSIDNQIVSFNDFNRYSDILNLSFSLYKSIELKISNKFDEFALLNPAFGLQYAIMSLKHNFIFSYTVQNLTSNMIQNSINLHIKIN